MLHAAKLGLGRSTRLGVVLALAALTMFVPVSVAQTPVSEEAVAEGPHPAHIHTGTCDALGEVVHPLTDVAAPTGETQGATTAHTVKIGHTVLDVPLQEIIDGGHAINVHQSAEEIDTYIACGDVGGVVFEEGGRQQLVIGLGELNDSGHHGVAWLGSDGDRTEVSVELVEPDRTR
jgi:hypothetical protein